MRREELVRHHRGRPDDSAEALEGSEDATLLFSDHERAGEALGLEAPGEGADEDELADWFLRLQGVREDEPRIALLPSQFTSATALEDEAWREEVGWAPVDVDRSLDVLADDRLYLLEGDDFDGERIDDACNA